MRQDRFSLSGIIRFFTFRQTKVIGVALITLVLALAALFSTQPAHAATTWTVTTNGDSNGGACTPANCDTLRDAMINAASGDTVVFGISGTTITLSAPLPNVTTTLTIDGTGQNVTISGNNRVEVLNVANNGKMTLKGLTVANGNSAGGTVGGGLANNGGTVTISNSIFSGDSASSGGGLLNYPGGTVTISNSVFSGNSASGSAGGGLANFGTVTISNSIFSGNSATGGGGGLYNLRAVTISNSTFSGN